MSDYDFFRLVSVMFMAGAWIRFERRLVFWIMMGLGVFYGICALIAK